MFGLSNLVFEITAICAAPVAAIIADFANATPLATSTGLAYALITPCAVLTIA